MFIQVPIMPKPFICVASGPSLTADDCAMASDSGCPIIAVNSSWRAVPECHHIFAGDCGWWDVHYSQLDIPAKRWSTSGRACLRYGVNHYRSPDNDTFNSGQRAIQLAAHLGAERVILLGYDCSLANGVHWHGEHPPGLKNPDALSVVRWREEFARVAVSLRNVEIINCSRSPSLTCFRRETPEKTLGPSSWDPGPLLVDLSYRMA
jgi:hypothetical protein